MPKKFEGQEYRDQLAGDLKSVKGEDKKLAHEISDEEKQTKRYVMAKDARREMWEKGEVALEELAEREGEKIKKFFGYDEANVPAIPTEVTPEKYEKWRKMGLEFHYLPNEELAENRDLPGWKHKPVKGFNADSGFFENVRKGHITDKQHGEPLKLPGAWVLVDGRIPESKRIKMQGPYYDMRDIFNDDPLREILSKLRKDRIITSGDQKSGRSFISWDELHKPEVKKAIAETLDVPQEYLRLPSAIERNYIGNAYHPEWGESEFQEWTEDVEVNKDGRSRYGEPVAILTGEKQKYTNRWKDTSYINGLSSFSSTRKDSAPQSSHTVFRPFAVFSKSGE